MKKMLFGALLLSLAMGACKKEKDAIIPDNPGNPAGKLKLPLGNVVGPVSAAKIGPAGAVIKSADGIMTVTVPAGAVDVLTDFTITQVTNSLKSKGYSYRLTPDDVQFKKDISISYYYGGHDLGAANPKMLFLALQDKDGYYFSMNNTKGNTATHTLTAATRHFSDWTFYAKYDLVTEGLVNGKVYLGKNEQTKITLTSAVAEFPDDPMCALMGASTNSTMRTAVWDYVDKTGALHVNQLEAYATYKSPGTLNNRKELIVTCKLTGDLGKDNEGNKIGMLQLVQPIVLEPDGYFILTEDGEDMASNNFSAEFIQLVGTEAYASFPNGYNLTCHTNGVTGSFPYDQYGMVGKAIIQLVPADGQGYRTYRPTTCDGGTQPLFHSPGSVVLTSVANAPGEYTAGHFTATLFKYSWCPTGGSKSISGKFKIKK